jgi:hypothetical protein
VGTDNPTEKGGPFATAWTPDGQQILITNYRPNSISIVDLKRARSRQECGDREDSSHPRRRTAGAAQRNSGDAGRSLRSRRWRTEHDHCISNYYNLTGNLHVIDVRARTQIATVAAVGIDPYSVVLVDKVDGD